MTTIEENKWREVAQKDAQYVIVFRPGSYDTSTYFFKNLEDVKWAMKHSWFDPKEATVAKILPWEIEIKNNQ